MAESENQWPSENEDFDATADKVEQKDESSPKKVAVSVAETAETESVTEPTESEPEADTEPPEAAKPEKAPEPPRGPEPAKHHPPVRQTPPPPHRPQPLAAAPTGKVSRGRLLFEAVLVILVIALGLWSWSVYSDRNNLKDQVAKLNANPLLVAQKQSDALIHRVGLLIDLPSGETPTIANVSDVTQAKKQSAFFNNAQNGDKVLMYAKAGEAILYRPSTNKIILVAPLTFNNTGSTSSTSTSSTTNKTTTTTPKTTTSN